MVSLSNPHLKREVSPLALLPGLPTLDETYGVLLIGSFVGLISYGVLVHQVWRYMRTYGDDKLVNKYFVSSALAIDTIHSVACMHACYTYLVTNYLRPAALFNGVWSISIQPLLAGAAVLVCQSFFARRVYIISKGYRLLVAVSMLLTFVTFGFAIAGTAVAFKFNSFLQYQHFYWIDSAACGTAIASDLLTCSVLIVTLRHSRTGIKQTNALLNTLILYTINTGLLTGIVNAMALIFALVRPDTMIWIAIEIVAIRLYTNSVLAVLNTRQTLKRTADRSGGLAVSLELPRVPKARTNGSSAGPSQETLRQKPEPTPWDTQSAVNTTSYPLST